MDKAIITTCIVGLMVSSFMIGFAGADRRNRPQISHEAYFGMLDAYSFKKYPECQTEMSDQWSTRLMYLSGVWTAACLNKSYEMEKPIGEAAYEADGITAKEQER
tara:strand:+ start:184 stop:498 length:315 start_codon:yes stop_codon:yes gene_type:complete